MNLTSLNADLEKIRPNQPPVLEETLHALLALCLDIQSHCGKSLYDGVVRDYRELNNNLAGLSEVLCDIYDANSAEIKKNTQDAFPVDLRTVRKETREAKQRLLSQEGQLDDMATAKAELEKLLAQEKQNLTLIAQEEARVRKDRDALEQTTAKIRGIDLPALEQEKARLEAEQLRLEQQMAALRARIDQLKALLKDAAEKCGESQRAVDDLTAELDRRTRELAQLEDRMRELTQQLAAVNSRIAAAQNHCQALAEKIRDREAQLHQLEQKIAESEARLSLIEAEIDRLSHIYDELRPRLERSNEMLERLKKQISEAQETIDSNDRAIADCHAHLANQENTIRQQQQTLDRLHNDIAERDARIADLDNQIAGAEGGLAQLTAACEAREQTLNKLLSDIRVLEADLRDLTKACDDAAAKIDRLLQQRSDANQHLQELKNQIAQLESEIDAARAHIQALTDTIKELRSALDACLAHIRELEIEKSETDHRVSSAQAEADRLTALVEAAKAKEAQLKELIAKYNQTLEQLANVEQDIQTAQAQLDQAKQKLAEAETRKNELAKEISTTESETQRFVQESAEKAKYLETANAEWSKQHKIRSDLHNAVAKTVSETASLKHKIKSLNEELEKVNGDAATAEARIAQLEEDISAAKQEYDALFGQLYTKQQELDRQNQQNDAFRTGELQTAQEDLDAAEQQLIELTSQCNLLKQEKATTDASLTRTESEIKRIRLDLLSLQSQFGSRSKDLDQELAKFRQEKARLEALLHTKEVEFATLDREIAVRSDKLAQLDTDIKAAQTSIESNDNVALEEEYTRILAEKKQKLQELANMEAELPALSNELDNVRARHENILHKKEYAESEIRRLSEELDVLQQELAKLNSQDTRERIEQYRIDIAKLTEIHKGLVAAARSLDLKADASMDHLLDWQLDAISGKLTYYRCCIQDYTDMLRKTIHN